jgi:hypothetical protein
MIHYNKGSLLSYQIPRPSFIPQSLNEGKPGHPSEDLMKTWCKSKSTSLLASLFTKLALFYGIEYAQIF